MDKKLKILVLSYLFPNKVHPDHGIFVLNRIVALSKYADIKVINPIPWSPLHNRIKRYKQYSEIPEVEIINGIEVYHPKYLSIPKHFKFIELITYFTSINSIVKKIHKKFDFDIVDMHWTFPDLFAGLRIANKFEKKTIVTLRGMEAFHMNENNAREKSIINGLISVDKIIGLSNELVEYGEKISNNQNKSQVIINGVNTDQFYYIPMQECRKKVGVADDELFILSIGSLIKRKGFDLLISSLANLKKQSNLSKLKLYIIGSQGPEGDYRKHLFNMVESLNLVESVVFVGQINNSELNYWYNSANAFCLSSRGEGSPNVLSEALACGCPVVSSNVGSAEKIINLAEGNALCVNALSEEELTTSLSTVLNNSADREKNALSYSCYSWDWCAKNVHEVYKSL